MLMLLFFEPYVGLIIYIACLYVRPQDFIAALQETRLMLVVGGATVSSMMLRLASHGRPLKLMRSPVDVIMWWFLLSVILSHLAHSDLDGALLSGASVFRVVMLYFLITNLVTSERRLSGFTQVLLIMTVILAVQGIVQYYTGVGIAGQSMDEERRIQSLAGFGNPNALAMALLIVLPFAYFDYVGHRDLAPRVYSTLSFVTIMFALYLTNSRGAIVGLAGMSMILLLRQFGWVKGSILSVGVMALLVVFGPSRVSTISTTEPSAYGRILLWDEGLRLFGSNPLFGIGGELWGSAEFPHTVAHNSFIHCAAELGILGLLPWVMLILLSTRWSYFVMGTRNERLSDPVTLTAKKVFFACAAYVLTMIFISKTYNPLLFIIVGLASATTNLFVERSGGRVVLLERKDVFIGLLLTFGGLIAFKVFVMLTEV
jgi:O-antigen ligase